MKGFLLAFGLLFATSLSATGTVQNTYRFYAALYGVDPDFVEAMAFAESEHRQHVISRAGAIGILQIMPATGAWFCVMTPAQLRILDNNVRCGVSYMAYLFRLYRDPALVAAAYNAGPGAVARYRGVPPYWETRRHVFKVMTEYRRLKKR